MTTSATSFASWRHSMVRFVTTRIRSAKIVVASVTANTTVRNNVTSLLTSFAVCVAAPDTWRATVPLTKGLPTVSISPGSGPGGSPSQAMVKGGFDSEYASLMAELGETGKGPGPDSARGSWGGGVGDITSSSSNVPPWRRPEVWQSALGSLSASEYRLSTPAARLQRLS
jgi:hypothetical protein